MTKTGKWFVDRFIADPTKVQSKCEWCNRAIFLPKSKAGLYKTCGGECKDKHRAAMATDSLKQRARTCGICNASFYPRLTQIRSEQGKYCSIGCRNVAILPSLLTDEAKAKSRISWRKAFAEGRIVMPSGPDHPRYQGGKEASYQRRMASGALQAARRRQYDKWPERGLANTKVFDAIKSGKLARQPCFVCGKPNADAHHAAYDLPLAVTWLCRLHHRQLHTEHARNLRGLT